MTASAANGFAQVKFDPTGTSCTWPSRTTSTRCTRTSSPQTRVIWAAHTYNVALGYGAHLPGSNTNFGRNAQYGSLLDVTVPAVWRGWREPHAVHQFPPDIHLHTLPCLTDRVPHHPARRVRQA